MKILVVDDEALLVKGIRFNLQNEGYDVITGSDGLEAVRAVQEQSPDLVVLDVMMPNMDGLTACAKIREFSDIPIIMLTAKTDDMEKLIGFDHGADGYLVGNSCIVTVLKDAVLSFPAGKEGTISVFCMGADAEGVTLEGLYYPLDRGRLTAGFPLGVSNHFTGKPARISVETGSLLILWDRKNGFPER